MRKEVAILIGGGQFVFEEYEQAKQLCESVGVPWRVFCANDMCTVFKDHIDYACMIHTKDVNEWIEGRLAKGWPMPGEVWAHRFSEKQRTHGEAKYVQKVLPCWRGSVGLFMVQVARELGFPCHMLCGVPICQHQLHVIRRKSWGTAALSFRADWEVHRLEIKDMVRSFSGWTREQFGSPEPQWLRERLGLVA